MRDSTFYCDKCGLCCQHLELFGDFYIELNDGTGTCRYFDKQSNLCKIYDQRPLICSIEAGYDVYFKEMPYEEYIKATKESCLLLKKFFNY